MTRRVDIAGLGRQEVVALLAARRAMIGRCHNPRHPGFYCYGARGIDVCGEWRRSVMSFMAWAIESGYRQGLAIDRRDNNRGYSPDNCRWVASKVNANNRRTNRVFEAFGESKTAKLWSEDSRCLVSYPGLIKRLNSGWHAEAAMTTPPTPRALRGCVNSRATT